jgi:hypothetical protein
VVVLRRLLASLALAGCTADPCHVGPYLQAVTPESATISWETVSAEGSSVEWGLTPSLEQTSSSALPVKLHHTTLEGLLPDTEYQYRVVSGGRSSPLATFTTAPASASPFRFAVYGDTQNGFWIHALIADAILEQSPKLVVHVGDEVGNGHDHASWRTEYFGPGSDLMASVPVYAAMGNHEDDAPWFYRYHSSLGGRSWYAFAHGGAFFVVIDTNKSYAPGSAQHDWIVRTLGSADARAADWLFTVYHHPAHTTGWDGCGAYDGEPGVRSHLVPLERAHGVDVTFNGHSHGYKRGFREGTHQIVSGGGGGDLDRYCGPNPAITVAEFVHHFVTVDVDADRLHLRARKRDGSVFDELVLAK